MDVDYILKFSKGILSCRQITKILDILAATLSEAFPMSVVVSNQFSEKIEKRTKNKVFSKQYDEIIFEKSPIDFDKTYRFSDTFFQKLLDKDFYSFSNKEFKKNNGKQYDFFCFLMDVTGSKKIYSFGLKENKTLAGAIHLIVRNMNKEELKFIKKLMEISSLSINNISREKELVRKRKITEEKDKNKVEFISNISHEIRTPLNAILGFSLLLRQDDISVEKRKKYVEIITQKSNDLLHVLNDMIDISLIESGNLVIENKFFSLNELLDDLYKYYSTRISPGINFSVEKGKINEESFINSDPLRVKQVLTNLLNNSINFTTRGYIRFGYEVRQNDLLLYVKDSGLIIPRDKKRNAYKHLSSLKNDLNREVGSGNSLGLSISKEITHYLDGKIWKESKRNGGTDFFVSLPLLIVKKENALFYEEKEDNEISFFGKNILVAEDDIMNYEYLNEILSFRKANVYWARDGLDAIKIVEDNNIDIILMDIKMPKMNGIEATCHIKKKYPFIPIIAQTAYALEQDKEKCSKAGCSDYLLKPIIKKKLFDTLQKYLNRN